MCVCGSITFRFQNQYVGASIRILWKSSMGDSVNGIVYLGQGVGGGDELSWTTRATMETTNETKRIYLAQTGAGGLNKYSG